ncbi:MAG: hypothetical protein L0170_00925 [Acidobacteria bacterium]|nr:hypothetical protein [Acidobacteriota bacterium]
MIEPSTNGLNGRDSSGRFLPGNAGGPGNPYAKRIAALRTAMLEAVSEDDMRAILERLVDLAKSGSVPAAKEMLDRCLGRTVEADLIERLEQLEEALAARARR